MRFFKIELQLWSGTKVFGTKKTENLGTFGKKVVKLLWSVSRCSKTFLRISEGCKSTNHFYQGVVKSESDDKQCEGTDRPRSKSGNHQVQETLRRRTSCVPRGEWTAHTHSQVDLSQVKHSQVKRKSKSPLSLVKLSNKLLSTFLGQQALACGNSQSLKLCPGKKGRAGMDTESGPTPGTEHCVPPQTALWFFVS